MGLIIVVICKTATDAERARLVKGDLAILRWTDAIVMTLLHENRREGASHHASTPLPLDLDGL